MSRFAGRSARAIRRGVGALRGSRRCARSGARIQPPWHCRARSRRRLDDAQQAFSHAIAVARAAGIPDLWGLAAQNLGVIQQRRGDYDQARELVRRCARAVRGGQAQRISSSWRSSTWRTSSGSSAYGNRRRSCTTRRSRLAQRIGQSDIEIGATAGAALCHLELGRIASARSVLTFVTTRLTGRPDWFQGRELAEAFAIRMAALDGRNEEALSRFDRALALAEASDMYSAAWLTVVCADALVPIAPEAVKESIEKYRERVRALGYPEMTRRYDSLASR